MLQNVLLWAKRNEESEMCDPLRVIPQVHGLINYMYFSSPTSSAFQLGVF